MKKLVVPVLGLFLQMMSLAAVAVGDKAPDFTLRSTDNMEVKLSDMTPKATTVLVVLRGYPGYQCPFCTRQSRDFIKHAAEFASAGAQVVMVYPGPSMDLDKRAAEFLKDTKLPENVKLLLDPDYELTNRYGLRWEAEHETAYPSTFVLNHDGVVAYAKISREHGGRTTSAEVLKEVAKVSKMSGMKDMNMKE